MKKKNNSKIRNVKINIDEILKNGTKISTEEALKDVQPFAWTQETLDGKYRGKVIIKSYNER